jgi:DNA-binding CsgD family transcriptional regulator
MKGTRGPARSKEGYHWFRGWRKPTAAQRRVLDELLAGGTNAQIAARIGISEDGVKWHLSELRDEVGLADRRELAEWWARERSRPAVNLLVPFAALWRFASQSAVATAVIVGVLALSLAIGWFAYDGLRSDGDEPASSVAVNPTPSPVPVAPFIRTPTPTPGPLGALLFDLDTGESTVLPGVYNDRRWLDTQAMTFTITDGKATVIDAEGQLTPIAERSGVQVVPDTDKGHVVIWNWDGGLVEVANMETGEVTGTADFGRVSGSTRNWAVSAVAGKIAISDEPYEVVTTYNLDGSGSRTVFTADPGRSIASIDWSRGGEWLVVVTGRQDENGRRINGEDHSYVFDTEGALVFERDGRATSVGMQTLQVRENSTGGVEGALVLLDIAHQAEISPPLEGTLICVSPDSRYAVLGGEGIRAIGQPPIEHKVYDLVTHEVVLTAQMGQFLPNCDWTPDGSKVVLSSGGK